jgi:hypothetical protein
MARKIKQHRQKGERAARIRRDLKAQSGLDRVAHFSAGGTLAAWRGIHTVTRNAKRYRRPQGRQDHQEEAQ